MEADPYNRYLKIAMIATLIVITLYIISDMYSRYKKQVAEDALITLLMDSVTE